MSPDGDLKIGQGHQNLIMIRYIKFGKNPSFSSRNSKRKHNLGLDMTCKIAVVTLKIRSRSPNSNKLFPPPNNV